MLIIGDSNSSFIKLNGFENLAEVGSRVRDVIAKLKLLGGGEILILGVGVNDCATIVDLKSGNKLEPNIEQFRKDYSELLSLAKSKFKRVIVLGLVSSTEERVRFGDVEVQYSNKTIIKFNNLIRDLCTELEVDFVDLIPYFLAKEKELLADHIHPNKKGLEIILSCLNGKLRASSAKPRTLLDSGQKIGSF